MFQTRCKYSKHVANISNALGIFKTRCNCFNRAANICNAFKMFQTRCKYSKNVVNVSTALYSHRVANSRNKRSMDLGTLLDTCNWRDKWQFSTDLFHSNIWPTKLLYKINGFKI